MIELHGETKDQYEALRALFSIGDRFTMFVISPSSAMTWKTEFTVRGFEGENVVFTARNKRKKFLLRLVSRSYQSAPLKVWDGALFRHWETDYTCDTDGYNVSRGNACYNFVGKPADIRAWIERDQLNALFDKSAVVAIDGPSTAVGADEVVVYPELYQGGHAVIGRLLTAGR